MKRIILFLLLLSLVPSRLAAHETWLEPATFASAPGAKVAFSLTSGMKFPELDYAIRPERIALARFRLGATTADLAKPTPGKSALRFEGSFPAEGLVTAWVTLAPKTLELSDEQVVEYFAEISAPPEVRARWANLKGHLKWKETYTKCGKTFLLVGKTSSDESWKEPVGMPLEIVPLNDPTSLKVGEKAAFQLLKDGRPLSDIALGLIAEKSGRRDFQTTDSEGRATFPLDQTGRALLYAVHLQWRDDQWQSNFTTLTVQVAP